MWNPIKRLAEWYKQRQQPVIEVDDEGTRQVRLWDTLTQNRCPRCDGTVCAVARVEATLNLECERCHTRYWWTPYRGLGAKILQPPQEDNHTPNPTIEIDNN